jgi:hypothetical protein
MKIQNPAKYKIEYCKTSQYGEYCIIYRGDIIGYIRDYHIEFIYGFICPWLTIHINDSMTCNNFIRHQRSLKPITLNFYKNDISNTYIVVLDLYKIRLHEIHICIIK